MRSSKGWLELTWMGKDIALSSSEDSKYDHEWVGPRAWEVERIERIDLVRTIGKATSATGANKNLLIVGDSGDAVRSRTERSVCSSR